MRALVLRAPHTPFELAIVPDPVPGPGEPMSEAEALHAGVEAGEVTGRAALLIDG